MLIIFLLLLNIFIFYKAIEIQKKELFISGSNISTTLDLYIKNVISDVDFINTVASEKIKHQKNLKSTVSPLKYADNFKKYSLNDEYLKNTPHNLKVNIAGYAPIIQDKKTLLEIQMSLDLVPFFKTLKEENKNYAWLYYFSNKNFLTLYPYVKSNIFSLEEDLKTKPLFQYGTPKLNPDRKIFTTPLYMDTVGKGLMITVGKPVYDKDKFLGVTEIDITLNMLSNLLKKLDLLNNKALFINDKLQILGQNNILYGENKEVVRADKFVSPVVFKHPSTKNEIALIDLQYMYISNLESTSFKFIYFQSAYSIWFIAFLYTLPVFVLMILIVYMSNLYYRTKELNEKLAVSEAKFKDQAIHDFMTKIHNRRYFFESGEAILKKSIRKKSPIAVCMIDIDKFKTINDTYGHLVGDELIINTTKFVQNHLRVSDLFARFGGDEFCVLLEDISKEDLVMLFEKIRNSFETDITSSVKYTLSFGIAFGHFSSLQEAIDLADTALYKSKENGRNMVTLEIK